MEPDQIPRRPAIEGLAHVADAPVERCLHHGARWTLSRILERRLAIASIMVVRRVGGVGIPYGKGLVGRATKARVDALGAAIDFVDAPAAVDVLDEWMSDDHAENERLVRGLLDVFDGEGPEAASG